MCKMFRARSHVYRDCTNNWKCSLCMQPGHKRGKCTTYDTSPHSYESKSTDKSDNSSDEECEVLSENNNKSVNTNTTKAHEENAPNHDTPRPKRKKAKHPNSRELQGQTQIKQLITSSANVTEMPKTGTVARSPPTPAEELQEVSKRLGIKTNHMYPKTKYDLTADFFQPTYRLRF